jgi:hypothetical protein
MNFLHQHLLASADDENVGKIAVAVVAIIIWAIGALAKKASQSTNKQKERLRQVRESIERAHAQQQPVTLNPEIARRLPPVLPQRPPVVRRPNPAGRAATNYDQMTGQPRTAPPPVAGQRIPAPRQVQSRPRPAAKRPIPRTVAQRPMTAARPAIAAPPSAPPAEVILLPEATRPVAEVPRPVVRPAITATSINRWATPDTLRQQFILTEIFQPPLAMREERYQ